MTVLSKHVGDLSEAVSRAIEAVYDCIIISKIGLRQQKDYVESIAQQKAQPKAWKKKVKRAIKINGEEHHVRHPAAQQGLDRERSARPPQAHTADLSQSSSV